MSSHIASSLVEDILTTGMRVRCTYIISKSESRTGFDGRTEISSSPTKKMLKDVTPSPVLGYTRIRESSITVIVSPQSRPAHMRLRQELTRVDRIPHYHDFQSTSGTQGRLESRTARKLLSHKDYSNGMATRSGRLCHRLSPPTIGESRRCEPRFRTIRGGGPTRPALGLPHRDSSDMEASFGL